MKRIELSQLYSRNYRIDVINSCKQDWNKRDSFSCMGKPKEVDMLLYLDELRAEYHFKNGEHFFVSEGSLIYLPKGSEYSVRFFNKKVPTANTVGINFHLYDEASRPFLLSHSYLLFPQINCRQLIEKINTASEASLPCYGDMKSGMYELITMLSRLEKRKSLNRYAIIEKGISYLETDSSSEISVSELAKLCHVSEIYFRKLFKEYSGFSPSEYKIRQKIERAKTYLIYEDFTIAELAELLNFSDASHFCKQFKKHTGNSPLQYRLQQN